MFSKFFKTASISFPESQKCKNIYNLLYKTTEQKKTKDFIQANNLKLENLINNNYRELLKKIRINSDIVDNLDNLYNRIKDSESFKDLIDEAFHNIDNCKYNIEKNNQLFGNLDKTEMSKLSKNIINYNSLLFLKKTVFYCKIKKNLFAYYHILKNTQIGYAFFNLQKIISYLDNKLEDIFELYEFSIDKSKIISKETDNQYRLRIC